MYESEVRTVEYSYKFRLYPTKVQQEQISRNFGCCRYVFNHFLAQRQGQYRKTGKSPTRYQQDKSLTALKQELPWLREVDSTSLQAAIQDLDAAFQHFFHRVKQGKSPATHGSRASTTTSEATKASALAQISKFWIEQCNSRNLVL